MLALVPVLRARLQRLVVAILVLLDQPLQADVPTDLETKLIALQQPEQARDPAIAISERVDAQKVEVERGQRDQGWHPSLVLAAAPVQHQVSHSRRSLGGRHSAKAHPLTAIRVTLDDVAILFLVLPGIPNLPARQCVQPLDLETAVS
jgi:hypothetical protein